MPRTFARGMVVLADGDPGTEVVLDMVRTYAVRSIAIKAPDVDEVPGMTEVVDAGRKGLTLDGAMKESATQRLPWIAVRRDAAPPEKILTEALVATGRRATKEVPGFALALGAPGSTEIRRILAVVDEADGDISGLMSLVAVGAAIRTEAQLDVLLLREPGASGEQPQKATDAVTVNRDKDLFDLAVEHAQENGLSPNITVVENVVDRPAAVMEAIAKGDYQMVIDDIGAVNVGGRFRRRSRIGKALRDDGPGGIARALLERSDVTLVVVLDAVRLGVIPPTAVKTGLGALLAFGLVATMSPSTRVSAAEKAAVSDAVTESTMAYQSALDQAASMAAPEDVEAAQAEAQAAAEQSVVAVQDAMGLENEAAEAEAEAATAEAEEAAEVAEEADGAEDQQASSDESADSAADEEVDAAPELVDPATVTPEAAGAVDPASVAVPEQMSSDEMAAAQQSQEQAAAELEAAQATFSQEQAEAVAAYNAVLAASEHAQSVGADLESVVAEFQDSFTAAEQDEIERYVEVFEAAMNQGDVEAADDASNTIEAGMVEAVGSVTAEAQNALDGYQAAAHDYAQAMSELQAAAAAVTAADAAVQTASATTAAYEQGMEQTRVSPVAEGSYTQSAHYGVAGPAWSTGYHTGEDYAAAEGTEVVAAASGTVVSVGFDGSYGNRVVIEHEDGYYTTYNHLSSTDVQVGQEVTAGERVGAVGNTGNSFGAHLHFEVTQGGDGWSSGDFVDPLAWLNGDI